MDPEENIAVAPSEDNGNVPVDAPESTPSEQPAPETPAETVETAAPAEATIELVELPDGRKVSPSEVVQEYKNLLSDYTKKSQELAKTKTPDSTLPTPNPTTPQQPERIPQTYEELFQIAEERALKAIEAKEQERTQAQQALEETVASQLAEVKAIDPNVNENSLFVHATKYGFRDLKIAHQNMKDMAELAKKVQQTTATNIAKRSDPVSVTPGATGSPANASSFNSAKEFLRSIRH